MSFRESIECDYPGCGAVRRQTNHWFVVSEDCYGVHVYKWERCPVEAMRKGKHLCGLDHMTQYVSKILTPDGTDPKRETTLELKPPLTREGTAPETPASEQETEKREEDGEHRVSNT